MQPEPTKSFSQLSILSYNTLIQKYSYTPNVKSDASWRNFGWKARLQQLILKMVTSMDSTDVICLQEIRHVSKWESPNFYDFANPLKQMGFQGVFSRRNIGGQFGQEGLAIFYNRSNFYLVETNCLFFDDNTGRNVLSVTLRSKSGALFKVVTTHIMYPLDMQKTKNQVEMLKQWPYLLQQSQPVILTGDFNLCRLVPSHYKILKGLFTNLTDAHEKVSCKKPTFSLNLIGSNCPGMIPQLIGTKIDYILVSKDIQVIAADVSGDIKDLPTAAQPSDHLAVTSKIKLINKLGSVEQDLKSLKKLFVLCQTRTYNDPNYKKFLEIFWALPRTVRNSAYQMSYKKCYQLGLSDPNNPQFGRYAFTNNIQHLQVTFDAEGNRIMIPYTPTQENILPRGQIQKIIDILLERVIVIPKLIKSFETKDLPQFLQEFDQKLHREACNMVYGETYKIACEKRLPTDHMDYGRVSFRKIGGWNIQNKLRLMAISRIQLP